MDFVQEKYLKDKYLGDFETIAEIGDGTVSGAIVDLNDQIEDMDEILTDIVEKGAKMRALDYRNAESIVTDQDSASTKTYTKHYVCPSDGVIITLPRALTLVNNGAGDYSLNVNGVFIRSATRMSSSGSIKADPGINPIYVSKDDEIDIYDVSCLAKELNGKFLFVPYKN